MKERLIPAELYDCVTITSDGGLDVMIDDDPIFISFPQENNVPQLIAQGPSAKSSTGLSQSSAMPIVPFCTPGLIGSADTTVYHGVDGGGDHTLQSVIQSLNETIQTTISNVFELIDRYCEEFGIESINRNQSVASGSDESLIWDDELEKVLREVNYSVSPVYTGDITFFNKKFSQNSLSGQSLNDFSHFRRQPSAALSASFPSHRLSTCQLSRSLPAAPSLTRSFFQFSFGNVSPSLDNASSSTLSPLQLNVPSPEPANKRLTRSAKIPLPPICLPDIPLEYQRKNMPI